MGIAQPRQSLVGFPSIGMHRSARDHRRLDKTQEVLGRTIGNSRHANASDASTVLLRRDDDQRLGGAAPSFVSGTTDLGFVHFDPSVDLIPTGADHGPTEFMQNRPRGLIAAQAQDTLQPQRAGSVLLAGHLPDRSTPQPQRQTAILENGPGSHCGLMTTASTDPSPSLRRPGLPSATLGTGKSFRPPQCRQVSAALLIGGKTLFHFQKRLRIVLNHPFTLPLAVGGVNRIPL